MLEIVIASLDRVGYMVFLICAITLATLDAAAVAAVIVTRSRDLVNRWTSPLLAANLVLAGAGLGVPSAMYFAGSALRAIAPATSVTIVVQDAPNKVP